jgi:hypothetical protein
MDYILSQTGNDDEPPLYLSIPSIYNTDVKAKFVGNESIR